MKQCCPDYNPLLRAGELELFVGPMKSGKTLSLITRALQLAHVESAPYLAIKPDTDVREEHIQSRFGGPQLPCVKIPAENPLEIMHFIKPTHRMIVIEEIQFFSPAIVGVVEDLLKSGHNVIAAGLDTDFRGEVFGPMGKLLAIATTVHKSTSRCDYPSCKLPATRTQRLVNGTPARYTDPIILVGDAVEGYQARCIWHHDVPGKPVA